MPFVRPMRSILTSLACAVAMLAALCGPARAQGADPNACDDPSEAPNVIVGDLFELDRWGSVGNITAFSVGTVSCNVGTCWLNWITGTGQNQHPTIGQNMFRLKDGRFEQLGQSWLKHGFYALSEELCSPDCLPTDGEHLGVNCSDPYSSNLNGTQTRLGPKFEVNALTGFHPHPVTDRSRTGDAIFKRLQVRNEDLDPALNPGALYFVEGQYVAEDDAAAGNQNDNASYRPVEVVVRGPDFDLNLIGSTARTKPAILAWADADPEVQVVIADDPEGGRFYIAGKATDLGAGTWHYEYAVQNLTSQRAARSFNVPIPADAVISNVGFHDVDYHSGEPFDLADWVADTSVPGAITWSTGQFDVAPNANALRWGTLYNFRFDADRPPMQSLLDMGLFRPGRVGDPNAIVFELIAPNPCNGNGSCDPGESCFSCPTECTTGGPDGDGDGSGRCDDCDDLDPTRWGVPGEVALMYAARGPAGELLLQWEPVQYPGANPSSYEVLRSPVASDFARTPDCLREADPTALTLADVQAPTAGPRLYYLVRSMGACDPLEPGTTGGNSFGVPRIAAPCP